LDKIIFITFGHGTNDKLYAYKLAPQLSNSNIEPGTKIICQTGDNSSVMVGKFVRDATPDDETSAATKWAFQLVDEDLNLSLKRG
jgi:hypothetical protein